MADQKKSVYVPTDLLEELERLFPNRIPAKLPTYEECAVLVGQQQVLQKLRQLHLEQGKTPLGRK